MKPTELTIRYAQANQPWTLPYDPAVQTASHRAVPHILGTHTVLHALKSLGKLAAVYESLDHNVQPSAATRCEQFNTARAMAADLVTAALRFANLHAFDLATALSERVLEKNASGIPNVEAIVRSGTAVIHDAPEPGELAPVSRSETRLRTDVDQLADICEAMGGEIGKVATLLREALNGSGVPSGQNGARLSAEQEATEAAPVPKHPEPW